jgi:hypothetical protein
MLRLGADARRAWKYGETALHYVAWRGRDDGGAAEVVRLLVLLLEWLVQWHFVRCHYYFHLHRR